MFVKRKAFVVQEQDNGNGNGNGGGGGIDLQSPEVKAAIEAAVAASVSGLKAKNDELLGKLKAVKSIPDDEFKQLMEFKKTVDANEELKLMAEGKIEQVMARRTEAMKRDFDAQINASVTKLSEIENLMKSKDEKLKTLMIDGQIREAYSALDFEPSALDDVIRHGRTIFTLDENGRVVPRDEHGTTIYSKDGKSPLGTTEWLTALADTKHYLRKGSAGAGAQQNRGGNKGFDPSKATSQQKIAEGLRQLGM